MLVARAAEAREVLPDALRKQGAKVDVVTLYETVAEEPDPEALERATRRRLHHLHLLLHRHATSSRRSSNGIPEGRAGGLDRPDHQRGSPGAGLAVDVEAERHDIEGLVEALLASGRAPIDHARVAARSQ